MNSDRAKGTIDEVVGGAKQDVGRMTGNTRLRVKGAAQQVKGALESALGKARDAAHGVQQEAAKERQKPAPVKPDLPVKYERSKRA
jgi:uncharacterized protein YjbJ (UPF0337 family)